MAKTFRFHHKSYFFTKKKQIEIFFLHFATCEIFISILVFGRKSIYNFSMSQTKKSKKERIKIIFTNISNLPRERDSCESTFALLRFFHFYDYYLGQLKEYAIHKVLIYRRYFLFLMLFDVQFSLLFSLCKYDPLIYRVYFFLEIK